MQIDNDDRSLLFENFYRDPIDQKSSFKIYEYKDEEMIFEFPLRREDYVEADYSGGVQKIEGYYLVGFPRLKAEAPEIVQYSFIGLISESGDWVKKGRVPFRIQDVKLLPFKNFLILNKVK